MKRLLLAAFICAAATTVFAQTTTSDTTKTDSVTHHKKRKVTIVIKSGDGDRIIGVDSVTVRRRSAYPRFSMGITIARLDLGLATLVDNGSFTLSPQNQFLRYRSWKTRNAAFDVFQMGVS